MERLIEAIIRRASADARRGDPEAQAWMAYLRQSLARHINESSASQARYDPHARAVWVGKTLWTPDGMIASIADPGPERDE